DANPPLVRQVKDEVREVAPGIWLGLAYLRMKDKDHLACVFGIARGSDEAACRPRLIRSFNSTTSTRRARMSPRTRATSPTSSGVGWRSASRAWGPAWPR